MVWAFLIWVIQVFGDASEFQIRIACTYFYAIMKTTKQITCCK